LLVGLFDRQKRKTWLYEAIDRISLMG